MKPAQQQQKYITNIQAIPENPLNINKFAIEYLKAKKDLAKIDHDARLHLQLLKFQQEIEKRFNVSKPNNTYTFPRKNKQAKSVEGQRKIEDNIEDENYQRKDIQKKDNQKENMRFKSVDDQSRYEKLKNDDEQQGRYDMKMDDNENGNEEEKNKGYNVSNSSIHTSFESILDVTKYDLSHQNIRITNKLYRKLLNNYINITTSIQNSNNNHYNDDQKTPTHLKSTHASGSKLKKYTILKDLTPTTSSSVTGSKPTYYDHYNSHDTHEINSMIKSLENISQACNPQEVIESNGYVLPLKQENDLRTGNEKANLQIIVNNTSKYQAQQPYIHLIDYTDPNAKLEQFHSEHLSPSKTHHPQTTTSSKLITPIKIPNQAYKPYTNNNDYYSYTREWPDNPTLTNNNNNIPLPREGKTFSEEPKIKKQDQTSNFRQNIMTKDNKYEYGLLSVKTDRVPEIQRDDHNIKISMNSKGLGIMNSVSQTNLNNNNNNNNDYSKEVSSPHSAKFNSSKMTAFTFNHHLKHGFNSHDSEYQSSPNLDLHMKTGYGDYGTKKSRVDGLSNSQVKSPSSIPFDMQKSSVSKSHIVHNAMKGRVLKTKPCENKSSLLMTNTSRDLHHYHHPSGQSIEKLNELYCSPRSPGRAKIKTDRSDDILVTEIPFIYSPTSRPHIHDREKLKTSNLYKKTQGDLLYKTQITPMQTKIPTNIRIPFTINLKKANSKEISKNNDHNQNQNNILHLEEYTMQNKPMGAETAVGVGTGLGVGPGTGLGVGVGSGTGIGTGSGAGLITGAIAGAGKAAEHGNVLNSPYSVKSVMNKSDKLISAKKSSKAKTLKIFKMKANKSITSQKTSSSALIKNPTESPKLAISQNLYSFELNDPIIKHNKVDQTIQSSTINDLDISSAGRNKPNTWLSPRGHNFSPMNKAKFKFDFSNISRHKANEGSLDNNSITLTDRKERKA